MLVGFVGLGAMGLPMASAARNVHVEKTSLRMGSEAGSQLSLGAASRQLLTQACARGNGRLDWTAILHVLGEIASSDATATTSSGMCSD
jgi:3-hydroxyisobutyrate dehydrogenase-like beta-hydroxyacid dehydrogenase